MLKRIFQLIFISMILVNFSFADDVANHQVLSSIEDLKKNEAAKTQEETVAGGWWPMIEGMLGCKGAEFVRDFSPFVNEYTCSKKDNNFNSEATKAFNAGSAILYKILSIFAAAIACFLMFVILQKRSSGHEEETSQRMAWNFSMISFTFIITILCFPSIKDDDGERNKTPAQILALSGMSVANEFLSKMMGEVASVDSFNNPIITIPSIKNQKRNQVYEIMRFFGCNSDNVNLGSGNRNGQISINYLNGNYSVFSQKGNCVLAAHASINMNTVKIAQDIGFDFKSFTDKQFQSAFTDAATQAQAVVNKIMARTTVPANPNAFDLKGFSCTDYMGYNINSLSYEGLADYAYTSSECISQKFSEALNKYPGIDESFYDKKMLGRFVHLCEQDTYLSSEKEMDTTPQLLKKGGSFTTLQQNLKQCVTKMCADNSSPYVCSASINYYDKMINNNHIIKPTLITLADYYLKTEFQDDKFTEDGKGFFNSFNVSSGRASTIYDEDRESEVLFKIPFTVGERGLGIAKDSDYILNAESDYSVTPTEMFKAVYQYFVIPGNGAFGTLYTKDCFAYPLQVSPSGRVCGSPLSTMNQQGRWLEMAGIQMMVGSNVSKGMRKTSVQKAQETASVEATKAGLKSVDIMGTGPTIGKFIALGMLDNAVDDAYSSYGTDMPPYASIAAGLAYAVPSIASLLSTFGATLQGAGLFLQYAPKLAIITIMLGAIITVMFVFVYFSYAFMLYFIILLQKNNGVNPTTDWYKTADQFVKYFMALFSFPIVLAMAFMFINTVFFVNALDVDAMMSVNDGVEANYDSMTTLPQLVIVMIIAMLIRIGFIGVILKSSAKTPTIVNAHIYGHLSDDEEDDSYLLAQKGWNI